MNPSLIGRRSFLNCQKSKQNIQVKLPKLTDKYLFLIHSRSRTNMIRVLLLLSLWLPLKANDIENARTLVISNGGIVKLIMGVAMPIDLPVSLVWAQNIQFQYFMIDNAAQLTYLNLLRSSNGISLTRNTVYKILAESWDRLGVNGTACVLRIICEVNRYSTAHTSLLGKILRTIFTPHKSTDINYAKAINNRFSGDNCKNYRSSCSRNIATLYKQTGRS